MPDEKMEAILDNEKEWRRYMMTKVDKLSDDMTILKVKVGIFGFLAGGLGSLLFKVFEK